MAAITGAGAGSGLALEDIIAATLSARKTQFEKQVVTREVNAKTGMSGLAQMKSALSEFNASLAKLYESGAFNKRSVTISQDKDNPVLKVSSKSGTSNGTYNIVVNQLASGSRYESKDNVFSSATQTVATADGKLTLSAGGKSFDVDIKSGDTLQDVRKRINQNGSNFGVTVNIVNTASSGAKLVFDSAVTGIGNELSIVADTAELKVFDTTDVVNSGLDLVKPSQDAAITIDGVAVTSPKNTFDDAVQDLSINLLRESDVDPNDATKKLSNKVVVSTDTAAVQSMVDDFIKSYNGLLDKLDALGKRPSIVAGVRQNDGGALAGDASIKSIKDYLFDAISTPADGGGSFKTIFDMGFKMNNKGRLELDNSKFSKVMENNFEQVGLMFGGESGLAKKISKEVDEYTRTGGLISDKNEVYNQELRGISSKRARFSEDMKIYEASLRQKYGALDALVVNLRQSISGLSSLVAQ